MEMNINSTDYCQPCGYVFRLSPQENNPDRYNCYMVYVSAYRGANNFTKTYPNPQEWWVCLFKIEGLLLDYNKYYAFMNHSSTPVNKVPMDCYSASPIEVLKYNNKWTFGYFDSTCYCYGAFPFEEVIDGKTYTNLRDTDLKTTLLGHYHCNINGNYTFNLKLDAKGDNIKIYFNDTDAITKKDNSYSSGLYGLFEYSNVKPKFYSLKSTYTKVKDFADINSQMKWRENSIRLVNTINTKEDNTIANPGIISSALNNNINYIMWSRLKNIDFNLNFIKNIENMGNAFYYKKDDEVGN